MLLYSVLLFPSLALRQALKEFNDTVFFSGEILAFRALFKTYSFIPGERTVGFCEEPATGIGLG